VSQPGVSDVHVPAPLGAVKPVGDDPITLPTAAKGLYYKAYDAHEAATPDASPDQCDAAGWASVRAAWKQSGDGWVKKSLGARLVEFLKAEGLDEELIDEGSKFDGIVKAVGDQRLVFGWANVVAKDEFGAVIPDRQGDCVDLPSLEDVAYRWIETERASGTMHVGKADGCAVESVIFTPEKIEKMFAGLNLDDNVREQVVQKLSGRWWIGVRVPDVVFKDVRAGRFRAFSIEGVGHREEIAA